MQFSVLVLSLARACLSPERNSREHHSGSHCASALLTLTAARGRCSIIEPKWHCRSHAKIQRTNHQQQSCQEQVEWTSQYPSARRKRGLKQQQWSRLRIQRCLVTVKNSRIACWQRRTRLQLAMARLSPGTVSNQVCHCYPFF